MSVFIAERLPSTWIRPLRICPRADLPSDVGRGPQQQRDIIADRQPLRTLAGPLREQGGVVARRHADRHAEMAAVAITFSITAPTSGWCGPPIRPSEPARSFGPITTLVSPGTERIASISFAASMCSICTITITLSFAARQNAGPLSRP